MPLSTAPRKPSADAPQHYPTKDLIAIVSASNFVENIMNAIWDISPHLRPSIKKRMEEELKGFLRSKLREFWDESLSEKQLDALIRDSIKNYGWAPNGPLVKILIRIFQSPSAQTPPVWDKTPEKVVSILR